jgi:cell division protein FtsB
MLHNIRHVRRTSWLDRFRRFDVFDLNRKKIYLIGGLVFFYAFVAGGSGFYAQLRLWKQGHDLQKGTELEKKKRKWLNDQVTSLSTDINRIQMEARKEAGLGQKDEIIIQVQQ